MKNHLNTKNTLAKAIEKLDRLKEIGIDTSKLKQKDTILTLAQKSGISEEKIKQLGLDPDNKIGQRIMSAISAYRGTAKGIPPTEEEKKQLILHGIRLEKQSQIYIQNLIQISEKLKAIGVDLSQMKTKDTIRTLAQKSGISEEEIRRIGLDPDYAIGLKRVHIARNYRKEKDRTNNTSTSTKRKKSVLITEEQIQKLLDLGIRLDYRDITQEFIEKLEKLDSIGVDVSKIKLNDTAKTLAAKSKIGEETVKKIGIDPETPLGKTKKYIVDVYNGTTEGVGATKEQVERLLKLRVSLERIYAPRNTEQIVKATISAVKEFDKLEQEREALKILVNKDKEERFKG